MKSQFEQLQSWLADKSLSLTDRQVEQLFEHLELLQEWNRVHNLTAVKNQDMLDYHVLDSLSVVPHLQGLLAPLAHPRLLDVGSGAGFPGAVLACVFPRLSVFLLESNKKKCRFLVQLKLRLGLSNLHILCQRVENHQKQDYQFIMSRATFNPEQLFSCCQHLLSRSSHLLAMLSGKQYQQNQNWLPDNHHVSWKKLQAPVRLGDRYLLSIAK